MAITEDGMMWEMDGACWGILHVGRRLGASGDGRAARICRSNEY